MTIEYGLDALLARRPEQDGVIPGAKIAGHCAADRQGRFAVIAGIDRRCAGGREPAVDVHRESDRRAAIDSALAMAETGDVVVIAGKGHETTQTASGSTRPFDDRVVARELLVARR